MTADTSTTDEIPELVINEETFTEAWKIHKPVMDYDPDQFPSRFQYDAKLTILQMKVAHDAKISILKQKHSDSQDQDGVDKESTPLADGGES